MDLNRETLLLGLAALGVICVMGGTPAALVARVFLLSAWGAAAFGVAVIAMKFPFAGLIALGLIGWWARRGWRGSQYAHGTAHFADLRDLWAGGMLGSNDGLILGRAGDTAPPPRWQAIRGLALAPLRRSALAVHLYFSAFGGPRWTRKFMIRVNNYVHLATFAPTGRGKTVYVIAPNLLSYPHSCVSVDTSGELFGLTARHRRRRFRNRVVRLDPFGIHGPGGDTFNPLDLIDAKAPDFIEQCRDLAAAMVVRAGTEHDPHWNDSAELIISSFIAFVAACETDPAFRNLHTVRELLSSRDKFARSVAAMQQSPLLQRQGHLMSWYQDKELASIMSTVQRHTAFLDSPAVAACTARSSFEPQQLVSSRMSVYCMVPAEHIAAVGAPLFRMWLSCSLRALSRGIPNEKKRVLFLIDETANLGGHIQALEDAVVLMRKSGIRLWFFFQSLAQLNKCFGDRAQVFLDNIDTQQYFGLNAFESAEALSKRMGDATITTESYNRTSGHSCSYGGKGEPVGNHSTGSSWTVSEMGRTLMKPDEITSLAENQAIIFHRNLRPILAELVPYYKAPEFRWGRTGKQRGMGLAASVMALFALVFTGVFAAFAVNLPAPVAPSRQAAAPAGWDVGGANELDSGQWNPEPVQRRSVPSHARSRRRIR